MHFSVFGYLFLYFTYLNNGYQALLEVPKPNVNDSEVLMKILKLFNDANSDERLFDVTFKLLKSVCVCLRKTLTSRERSLNDGNHLLVEDKYQNPDVYAEIYNRTCLRLKTKIQNKLIKLRDIVNKKDELVKNVHGKVQESGIIEGNHTNNGYNLKLLHKIFNETRNRHNYYMRKYSVLKQTQLSKNTLQDSIVIITLYPNINENISRADGTETISDIEINNALYTNSSVDIDVIDMNYEKLSNTLLTKTESMPHCVLQSMYLFLLDKLNRNEIKVFRRLSKNSTIKIYIHFFLKNNHDDYTITCCTNSTISACESNNKKSADIDNDRPQLLYKKTLSKIRKLFKIYNKQFQNDNMQSVIDNITRDDYNQPSSCSTNLRLCVKSVIEDNSFQKKININPIEYENRQDTGIHNSSTLLIESNTYLPRNNSLPLQVAVLLNTISSENGNESKIKQERRHYKQERKKKSDELDNKIGVTINSMYSNNVTALKNNHEITAHSSIEMLAFSKLPSMHLNLSNKFNKNKTNKSNNYARFLEEIKRTTKQETYTNGIKYIANETGLSDVTSNLNVIKYFNLYTPLMFFQDVLKSDKADSNNVYITYTTSTVIDSTERTIQTLKKYSRNHLKTQKHIAGLGMNSTAINTNNILKYEAKEYPTMKVNRITPPVTHMKIRMNKFNNSTFSSTNTSNNIAITRTSHKVRKHPRSHGKYLKLNYYPTTIYRDLNLSSIISTIHINDDFNNHNKKGSTKTMQNNNVNTNINLNRNTLKTTKYVAPEMKNTIHVGLPSIGQAQEKKTNFYNIISDSKGINIKDVVLNWNIQNPKETSTTITREIFQSNLVDFNILKILKNKTITTPKFDITDDYQTVKVTLQNPIDVVSGQWYINKKLFNHFNGEKLIINSKQKSFDSSLNKLVLKQLQNPVTINFEVIDSAPGRVNANNIETNNTRKLSRTRYSTTNHIRILLPRVPDKENKQTLLLIKNGSLSPNAHIHLNNEESMSYLQYLPHTMPGIDSTTQPNSKYGINGKKNESRNSHKMNVTDGSDKNTGQKETKSSFIELYLSKPYNGITRADRTNLKNYEIMNDVNNKNANSSTQNLQPFPEINFTTENLFNLYTISDNSPIYTSDDFRNSSVFTNHAIFPRVLDKDIFQKENKSALMKSGNETKSIFITENEKMFDKREKIYEHKSHLSMYPLKILPQLNFNEISTSFPLQYSKNNALSRQSVSTTNDNKKYIIKKKCESEICTERTNIIRNQEINNGIEDNRMNHLNISIETRENTSKSTQEKYHNAVTLSNIGNKSEYNKSRKPKGNKMITMINKITTASLFNIFSQKNNSDRHLTTNTGQTFAKNILAKKTRLEGKSIVKKNKVRLLEEILSTQKTFNNYNKFRATRTINDFNQKVSLKNIISEPGDRQTDNIIKNLPSIGSNNMTINNYTTLYKYLNTLNNTNKETTTFHMITDAFPTLIINKHFNETHKHILITNLKLDPSKYYPLKVFRSTDSTVSLKKFTKYKKKLEPISYSKQEQSSKLSNFTTKLPPHYMDYNKNTSDNQNGYHKYEIIISTTPNLFSITQNIFVLNKASATAITKKTTEQPLNKTYNLHMKRQRSNDLQKVFSSTISKNNLPRHTFSSFKIKKKPMEQDNLTQIHTTPLSKPIKATQLIIQSLDLITNFNKNTVDDRKRSIKPDTFFISQSGIKRNIRTPMTRTEMNTKSINNSVNCVMNINNDCNIRKFTLTVPRNSESSPISPTDSQTNFLRRQFIKLNGNQESDKQSSLTTMATTQPLESFKPFTTVIKLVVWNTDHNKSSSYYQKELYKYELIISTTHKYSFSKTQISLIENKTSATAVTKKTTDPINNTSFNGHIKREHHDFPVFKPLNLNSSNDYLKKLFGFTDSMNNLSVIRLIGNQEPVKKKSLTHVKTLSPKISKPSNLVTQSLSQYTKFNKPAVLDVRPYSYLISHSDVTQNIKTTTMTTQIKTKLLNNRPNDVKTIPASKNRELTSTTPLNSESLTYYLPKPFNSEDSVNNLPTQKITRFEVKQETVKKISLKAQSLESSKPITIFTKLIPENTHYNATTTDEQEGTYRYDIIISTTPSNRFSISEKGLKQNITPPVLITMLNTESMKNSANYVNMINAGNFNKFTLKTPLNLELSNYHYQKPFSPTDLMINLSQKEHTKLKENQKTDKKSSLTTAATTQSLESSKLFNFITKLLTQYTDHSETTTDNQKGFHKYQLNTYTISRFSITQNNFPQNKTSATTITRKTTIPINNGIVYVHVKRQHRDFPLFKPLNLQSLNYYPSKLSKYTDPTSNLSRNKLTGFNGKQEPVKKKPLRRVKPTPSLKISKPSNLVTVSHQYANVIETIVVDQKRSKKYEKIISTTPYSFFISQSGIKQNIKITAMTAEMNTKLQNYTTNYDNMTAVSKNHTFSSTTPLSSESLTYYLQKSFGSTNSLNTSQTKKNTRFKVNREPVKKISTATIMTAQSFESFKPFTTVTKLIPQNTDYNVTIADNQEGRYKYNIIISTAPFHSFSILEKGLKQTTTAITERNTESMNKSANYVNKSSVNNKSKFTLTQPLNLEFTKHHYQKAFSPSDSVLNLSQKKYTNSKVNQTSEKKLSLTQIATTQSLESSKNFTFFPKLLLRYIDHRETTTNNQKESHKYKLNTSATLTYLFSITQNSFIPNKTSASAITRKTTKRINGSFYHHTKRQHHDFTVLKSINLQSSSDYQKPLSATDSMNNLSRNKFSRFKVKQDPVKKYILTQVNTMPLSKTMKASKWVTKSLPLYTNINANIIDDSVTLCKYANVTSVTPNFFFISHSGFKPNITPTKVTKVMAEVNAQSIKNRVNYVRTNIVSNNSIFTLTTPLRFVLSNHHYQKLFSPTESMINLSKSIAGTQPLQFSKPFTMVTKLISQNTDYNETSTDNQEETHKYDIIISKTPHTISISKKLLKQNITATKAGNISKSSNLDFTKETQITPAVKKSNTGAVGKSIEYYSSKNKYKSTRRLNKGIVENATEIKKNNEFDTEKEYLGSVYYNKGYLKYYRIINYDKEISTRNSIYNNFPRTTNVNKYVANNNTNIFYFHTQLATLASNYSQRNVFMRQTIAQNKFNKISPLNSTLFRNQTITMLITTTNHYQQTSKVLPVKLHSNNIKKETNTVRTTLNALSSSITGITNDENTLKPNKKNVGLHHKYFHLNRATHNIYRKTFLPISFNKSLSLRKDVTEGIVVHKIINTPYKSEKNSNLLIIPRVYLKNQVETFDMTVGSTIKNPHSILNFKSSKSFYIPKSYAPFVKVEHSMAHSTRQSNITHYSIPHSSTAYATTMSHSDYPVQNKVIVYPESQVEKNFLKNTTIYKIKINNQQRKITPFEHKLQSTITINPSEQKMETKLDKHTSSLRLNFQKNNFKAKNISFERVTITAVINRHKEQLSSSHNNISSISTIPTLFKIAKLNAVLQSSSNISYSSTENTLTITQSYLNKISSNNNVFKFKEELNNTEKTLNIKQIHKKAPLGLKFQLDRKPMVNKCPNNSGVIIPRLLQAAIRHKNQYLLTTISKSSNNIKETTEAYNLKYDNKSDKAIINNILKYESTSFKIRKASRNLTDYKKLNIQHNNIRKKTVKQESSEKFSKNSKTVSETSVVVKKDAMEGNKNLSTAQYWDNIHKAHKIKEVQENLDSTVKEKYNHLIKEKHSNIVKLKQNVLNKNISDGLIYTKSNSNNKTQTYSLNSFLAKNIYTYSRNKTKNKPITENILTNTFTSKPITGAKMSNKNIFISNLVKNNNIRVRSTLKEPQYIDVRNTSESILDSKILRNITQKILNKGVDVEVTQRTKNFTNTSKVAYVKENINSIYHIQKNIPGVLAITTILNFNEVNIINQLINYTPAVTKQVKNGNTEKYARSGILTPTKDFLKAISGNISLQHKTKLTSKPYILINGQKRNKSKTTNPTLAKEIIYRLKPTANKKVRVIKYNTYAPIESDLNLTMSRISNMKKTTKSSITNETNIHRNLYKHKVIEFDYIPQQNFTNLTTKTIHYIISATKPRNKIYTRKNIVHKSMYEKFRKERTKLEPLLDPFRKTDLYPIKIIPSKTQKKIMKRIRLVDKNREVIAMNTHDFFSQKRFETRRKLNKDVSGYHRQPLQNSFHMSPEIRNDFLSNFEENNNNRHSKKYFRPKPLFINNDAFYKENFQGHHKSGCSSRDKINYVRENIIPPVTGEIDTTNVIERPDPLPASNKPKFLRDRIDSIRSYLKMVDFKKPTRNPANHYFMRYTSENSDDFQSQEATEFYFNNRGWVKEDTTITTVMTSKHKRRSRRTLFFLSPTVPYRRYF